VVERAGVSEHAFLASSTRKPFCFRRRGTSAEVNKARLSERLSRGLRIAIERFVYTAEAASERRQVSGESAVTVAAWHF